MDLIELTVDKIQAGFASGEFTSETLTRAYLRRIEEYNPAYNAIIFLNDEALAEARMIDGRRAAGERLGPLAGIPIVIKDTIDMKGFPTTGGWSLLYSKTGGVDLYPQFDAPVTQRMRAAGAVILGKTNVPILSHSGSNANCSWAGPTYNSLGREFLPGGSSAGTATAVGANFCVLGLAEETGGSIQNPASAQGLVGVKPTFALVPNTGVMPLASLMDVLGPITRCVHDAGIALDVLAGFTIEDPKTVACIGRVPKGGYTAKLEASALRGKRIGLYGPGWRSALLSEETLCLYRRTQRELADLGAVLLTDPFADSGFAELRKMSVPNFDYDARGRESVAYDLAGYLQHLGPQAAVRSFSEFAKVTEKEDAFGPNGVLNWMHNIPEFREAFKNPSSPPDMSSFVAVREEYLRILNRVFNQNHLDAVIFPQMRTPLGSLHGDDDIRETVVSEVNIAGLPAVTVPAGGYASGAPYNIIIVGREWSEADLLAIAYAYEQGTHYQNLRARTLHHVSQG